MPSSRALKLPSWAGVKTPKSAGAIMSMQAAVMPASAAGVVFSVHSADVHPVHWLLSTAVWVAVHPAHAPGGSEASWSAVDAATWAVVS